MKLSTPQRLFKNVFNPNVMGYEIFILFPSIVLYFAASFTIGTISSNVISEEKNKNIKRTILEVMVSLWIIAIGHKLFTIFTPTSLDSASSNVIFAFVAMSANSKVEKELQSIVNKTQHFVKKNLNM